MFYSLIILLLSIVDASGLLEQIKSNNLTISSLKDLSIKDLIFDPLVYAAGIKRTHCIGIDSEITCNYPATPDPPFYWPCPPGNYCMSPRWNFKCPPGFYCPYDSIQPIYCPEKFVCSEDTASIQLCPEGFYCPFGTVTPISCVFSSLCPEGTDKMSRWPLLVLVLILLLLIYAAHLFKAITITNLSKQVFILENHQVVNDAAQLETKAHTFVDIKLNKIGLKKNKQTILDNINAEFKSGRMTAIMGPSGCGKSTLMSIILGSQSSTSGQILINNSFQKLQPSSIGYVPQEDILVHDLTVMQIILHAARIRLPIEWSRAKIKLQSMNIINLLGLTAAANRLIAEVSGGQKKRSSIGVELVAEPSVLLLDEPTSGLDSTTSNDLVRSLQKITHHHQLNSIAVIHSPSVSAFYSFDDLLLLGSGGKQLYYGPTERVEAYFQSIGFFCPPKESMPDFLMDVITGKVQCRKDFDFNVDKLPYYWIEYQNSQDRSDQISVSSETTLTTNVSPPSPLKKRASIQTFGNMSWLSIELLTHYIIAVILSAVLSFTATVGKAPKEFCFTQAVIVSPMCSRMNSTLLTALSFVAAGSLFIILSSAQSTFGKERAVFWRERRTGTSTTMYFLAKIAVDIPKIALCSVMFVIGLSTLYTVRLNVWSFYNLVFYFYLYGWSMGYAISVIFRSKTEIFVALMAIFWGIIMYIFRFIYTKVKRHGTPPMTPENQPEEVRWLWSISGTRWFLELMWGHELKAMAFQEKNDETEFGIRPWVQEYGEMNLIGCALLWLVLTFICIRIFK